MRIVLVRSGVFDLSYERQSCSPGQKLIIFNVASLQGERPEGGVRTSLSTKATAL